MPHYSWGERADVRCQRERAANAHTNRALSNSSIGMDRRMIALSFLLITISARPRHSTSLMFHLSNLWSIQFFSMFYTIPLANPLVLSSSHKVSNAQPISELCSSQHALSIPVMLQRPGRWHRITGPLTFSFALRSLFSPCGMHIRSFVFHA